MLDLVLHGGRVLDGTGNVDVVADVAVSDGKIAAIGRLDAAEARERLDVTGLTVCPGFIDPHCHSDALPFADDPLPAKILQGVTTEVSGSPPSRAVPSRCQAGGVYSPAALRKRFTWVSVASRARAMSSTRSMPKSISRRSFGSSL